MTNELQAYLPTGKTLYAVLLNPTGQVWDGSQFEAIAAGTWTDNDISLTEVTAGLYLADMPSVVAGSYSYVVYEQIGASPAITDPILGMGSLDWTGTAVLNLVGDIDAILEDTAMTIPAAIAAVDTDILAATVEGTYSVQDVLRIMVSALAGKLNGGGTGTLTFRDLSDTLDRIIATVDLATGDRDAITLDLT